MSKLQKVKNFNFFLFSLPVVLLFLASCSAKRSSVAVVVDRQTYDAISEAVDNYVNAITTSDREGVLVVDIWNNPDSIKNKLKEMYDSEMLEGAVFVGKIPVPMIRDAQHLTTAFKMSQKRPWIESSVPSDRFYDDFDLKFDYLGQDTVNTLAHYYSLRADSPQEITCDIYSARIKAPAGENEYEAIADFLNKAAEAHENPEKMRNVLHFAGHGYNSDSMNARMDEGSALREQFPFLNEYGGSLTYIDHTFDDFVRDRLLTSLEDEELDLAILHHHGSEDTQYFNGTPTGGNIRRWIDLSRDYLRSVIRRYDNPAPQMRRMVETYGIPYSWVSDAFDKDKIYLDSLNYANKNTMISDLEGYASGATIVVLDACFNGAFINDDYIAAHYIFNPGSTIAVKANTVNTLQDTWTNELMGLLNLGVCVGDWAKGQLTLESHLFGDPTFAFAPQYEEYKNLEHDIVAQRDNAGYWRKVLDGPADAPADLKALAIKMLYRNNAITSDELLQIAKESPYMNVRLEAFMTNCKIADENLSEAIKVAMYDNFELTRRLALIAAGKNADPILLQDLAKFYLAPQTTARELFQLGKADEIFENEEFVKALEIYGEKYERWIDEKEFDALVKRAERSYKSAMADIETLMSDESSARDKKFAISRERNNCNPFSVDGLCHVVEHDSDKELQLAAAEALGWFRYSYIKPQIVEKCKALYEKASDEDVKNELLKTINRLN